MLLFCFRARRGENQEKKKKERKESLFFPNAKWEAIRCQSICLLPQGFQAALLVPTTVGLRSAPAPGFGYGRRGAAGVGLWGCGVLGHAVGWVAQPWHSPVTLVLSHGVCVCTSVCLPCRGCVKGAGAG